MPGISAMTNSSVVKNVLRHSLQDAHYRFRNLFDLFAAIVGAKQQPHLASSSWFFKKQKKTSNICSVPWISVIMNYSPLYFNYTQNRTEFATVLFPIIISRENIYDTNS